MKQNYIMLDILKNIRENRVVEQMKKCISGILLAAGIVVLAGCAREVNTEQTEIKHPVSTDEAAAEVGGNLAEQSDEAGSKDQAEQTPVLLANKEYQAFWGTVGDEPVVMIVYREDDALTLYYTNKERTKTGRFSGTYDTETHAFDLTISYFSKYFRGIYYVNEEGQACIEGTIEYHSRNQLSVEAAHVRSHDCYEGKKANFCYEDHWEYDPFIVLSSVEIFAEAVLQDDKEILAEMLQYPFAVGEDSGVRMIRDKEGFERLYGEVITDRTKQSVLEGLQENLWIHMEEMNFGNVVFAMPDTEVLFINNTVEPEEGSLPTENLQMGNDVQPENTEADEQKESEQSNTKVDGQKEPGQEDAKTGGQKDPEREDVIKITQASESVGNISSAQSLYMEADFGRHVKTVKLYIEQWQNGSCTQSIPGIFTEDAKTAYVMMSFRYRKSGDYETSNGGVTVDADEYGGMWGVDFNFPNAERITNWYLSAYQQEEKLILKPGEDRILSVLTVNTGEDTEKLDCKMLEDNPESLKEAEYAVVLRLVCEAEAVTPKAVQNRDPLKMQMLYLADAVPLKDGKRKDAYIFALENMIYYGISPDGEDWLLCNYNDFTVSDVDSDGREELIIHHHGGIYSDNRILIYDYDSEKDALYREFDGFFEGLTFYDNGVVEVHIPHNHGPSSGRDDFWPHILYRYDASADTYEEIAFVEGWYRHDGYYETYEEQPFPEEADKDGDNMVYFINVGEWYVYEDPIDNEAYFDWRESIIGGAGGITFSFTELPMVTPEPKG